MNEKNNREQRQTHHHSVRMSAEAYAHVRNLASSDPRYRGRGVVGVLDDLLLGHFTTIGSGRIDRKRKQARDVLNGSATSVK